MQTILPLPTRQRGARDWLALFAGVSVRHQALLHTTLLRAAENLPQHE